MTSASKTGRKGSLPSHIFQMQFAGELDMLSDVSKKQTKKARSKERSNTLQDPSTGKEKSETHASLFGIHQHPPAYRYSVTGWFDSKTTFSDDMDSVLSGSVEAPKARDPLSFVSRMTHGSTARQGENNPISLPDYAPKRHKAKVIVWADLSMDAIDHLSESLNADHVKQVLADIFMLDNFKTNLKTGIIMDLYYYTLQFARDQKFTPEKTSAFFSIIKRIFEVCIETPFGNLDHTFEYFKDLVLCHSVNRPPYSIELFTANEVRRMTEYTINTFFRHFKMYKYAFTPAVRLDLNIEYEGMTPTPPPSEGSELKYAEGSGGDEEGQAGEEGEQQEEDQGKLAAQEELRNMIKEFLNIESRRIEGNIDQHIKATVENLNAKIDPMIGIAPKDTKAKKK